MWGTHWPQLLWLTYPLPCSCLCPLSQTLPFTQCTHSHFVLCMQLSYCWHHKTPALVTQTLHFTLASIDIPFGIYPDDISACFLHSGRATVLLWAKLSQRKYACWDNDIIMKSCAASTDMPTCLLLPPNAWTLQFGLTTQSQHCDHPNNGPKQGTLQLNTQPRMLLISWSLMAEIATAKIKFENPPTHSGTVQQQWQSWMGADPLFILKPAFLCQPLTSYDCST